MDVIEFVRPTVRVPSMNDSGHWRTRHAVSKAWKTAAYLAAVDTLGCPKHRRRGPSVVAVALPFARNGRRDPHNFTAAVKPIVDGLVLAEVWPDDTPEWVRTVEPSLVIVGRASPVVTVTLTPIEGA